MMCKMSIDLYFELFSKGPIVFTTYMAMYVMLDYIISDVMMGSKIDTVWTIVPFRLFASTLINFWLILIIDEYMTKVKDTVEKRRLNVNCNMDEAKTD